MPLSATPRLLLVRWLVAAGLLAVVAPLRAQNTTFYEIPPLTPNGTSVVLALSDDGNVVTGNSTDTNGDTSPFVWTVAGNTTAFTNTGSATNILPTAVSNTTSSTLVVGNCFNNGTVQAFLYDGTDFVLLPINSTIDQGNRATGVSDDGAAITVNGFGENVTSLTGYWYAPKEAGNYTGDYTFTKLFSSGVYAVTATGDRIVYLDPSTERAAVYNLITGGIAVAPAFSLANTTTYAINAISREGAFVAGVANTNTTTGFTRQGFLYNTGGNVTLLPPLNPTWPYAACRGVTDNGLGVGTNGPSLTFADESAVFFLPNGNGTVDMRQVLMNVYGLSVLANWTLNDAVSITTVTDNSTANTTTTIAGTGTDMTTGNISGFVVSLPYEPEDAPNLTILADPTSQTALIRSNVTLTVVAVPGTSTPGNLTYQWQFNGANISGAINDSLVLTSIGVASGGNYSVLVTNGNSTLASSAATLTVNNNLPIIITPPKSQSIKIGDSLKLSVVASNNPTAYQWYFNSKVLSGVTGTSYSLSRVAKTSAGSYYVQVTNGNGTVNSSTATITVLYQPTFTTKPSSTSIKINSRLELKSLATGVPAPTYQWYKNGKLIPGAAAKKANYIVSPAHRTNAGLYDVRAKNSQGTANTPTITVSVSVSGGNTTSGGNSTSGGNTTGGNGFGGNTTGG